MGEYIKIPTPFGTFTCDLSEASFIVGEPLTEEMQHRKFSLIVSEEIKQYEKMSYTTDIDTLNLIFDNMTIRSSCLTSARLNDPIEKERVGVSEFAGSRFITCFSHMNHESIPFWMYYGGNDRTIKILLQFRNFTSKLNDAIHMDYALVADNKKCFFNCDEYGRTINNNGMIGSQLGSKPINTDYYIKTCIDNMQIFNVEYVPLDSPIFSEDNSGEASIDFSDVSNHEIPSVKMCGYNPTVLGRQKSDPWDYERESRVMCTVSSQQFNEWKYIDLRLKSEMFRGLKIILSPWDKEELRGAVENIVQQSILPKEIKDSIVIENSGLKEKLNFPE